MTAELLTRAATLIRERAQAATEVWTPIHWRSIHADAPYSAGMRTSDLDRHRVVTDDEHGSIILTSPWDETQVLDHAASWDPAVALAVADQLEAAAALASWKDQIGLGVVSAVVDAALEVARTYLGDQS